MPQPQVLAFAEAVGARGVTALRSLGRAAFPQMGYSWDGLLPVDLGWQRAGRTFHDDRVRRSAPGDGRDSGPLGKRNVICAGEAYDLLAHVTAGACHCWRM